MELEKLIKYFDKKFSPKLAAKWDHSGFQIFNKQGIDINRNIERVLVCLDVTNDAIEQAVRDDVDLIVSRHPFIFNDLNDEKKIKKEAIKKLTAKNIYVYSIHTNYDASPNQALLEILNDNFKISKTKRFGSDNEGYEVLLKQGMNPDDFIKAINKCFDTDVCLLSNKFDNIKKVDKFFIVTGAGGGTMIEEQLKDCFFVTGEAKWNELVYANDNLVSIILKGHYMEEYFVDDIADKISNAFKDLQVEKFDIENQLKEYK